MKPNIIFISFDSVRPDHLGYMDYKKNTSPFLDSLAKKGTYFTRAFATGPGSPHSFVSIFTSTHPFDYGGFEYIDRPRVLLSEVLKKKGYTTIGLHSSAYLSDYFGYDRGWDRFLYLSHFDGGETMKGITPGTWQTKVIGAIDAIRFWLQRRAPWAKWFFTLIEKTIFGLRKFVKHLTDFKFPFYLAEEMNEEVKKILPSSPQKPVFLWIHYMDPHGPYGLFLLKSKSWLKRIKFHLADFIMYFTGELLPFVSKWFLPFYKNLYDSSIKYTDEHIGKLFQYLGSIGVINEESIVILCADHGEEFMEHNWVGHDATLWNVNLNVPLIFYGPKHISSGRVINRPVSLIDFSPTILDLAGLPKEPSFKGRNIFDEAERAIIGQVPFTEADLSNQKFLGASVIYDGYKLIHMLDKKKMLFSVENDFEEKFNLYDSKKEMVAKLEKILEPYECIHPYK